jgi:hypothetical protein
MGNTCGSCSFDNRGSEFDMEPKDKLALSNTDKENRPVQSEDHVIVTETIIIEEKQPAPAKPRFNKQPQFDVEDKENNFFVTNRAIEEKIEKEILGEKEFPNYESQGNQEEEFNNSFEFLDPPIYDCPEVMRIREESGAFNYEIGPYLEELNDGQDREKRELTSIDNEAKYQGEWLAGTEIRDGRGFQIWPDGSLYEGFWSENKANGRGRLIHADGDVYEGEWKDDKAHGLGVYIHADGAKYEGHWMEDKQHGKGVERWPDGAVYDGHYDEGQKHGEGCFKWSDGSVFTGTFYENNIEGYGIYEWNDGRKYEGEWKDNKMDGQGVFTWSDGRMYEGSYVQDMKEGFGIFRWPDGRRYEGQWFQGKQHGNGAYYTAKGKMRNGEWQNGKRIKWIK